MPDVEFTGENRVGPFATPGGDAAIAGVASSPPASGVPRREIAESVISGRKTGAEMARLYNVSAPTVSRIVSTHRIASL